MFSTPEQHLPDIDWQVPSALLWTIARDLALHACASTFSRLVAAHTLLCDSGRPLEVHVVRDCDQSKRWVGRCPEGFMG